MNFARRRLDQLFATLDINDENALQQFFARIDSPSLMGRYLEKLEQKRSALQPAEGTIEEKEDPEAFEGPFFFGTDSDARAAAGSGVLAGAFYPSAAVMTPEEEKECADFICGLYGNAELVYQWQAGLGETTLSRRKFKAQMEILIGSQFGCSVDEAMPNFYQYEAWYKKQDNVNVTTREINARIDSYYSTIKYNLERIYFLSGKSRLSQGEQCSAGILEDMEEEIRKCGAGILGHTVKAFNALMSGSSLGLRTWLAELRLGILEMWLGKKISEGEHHSMQVHLAGAVFELSAEMKLHIPGDESVAAVKELDARKRKKQASEFGHYFKRHYTRAAIIDCVANRLETEIKSIFPGGDRYFSWSSDMVAVLGSIFPASSQYGGGYFLDMDRVRSDGDGDERYFLRKIDFKALAEDILVEQIAIVPFCDFSAEESAYIKNALQILTTEQQHCAGEADSDAKLHIVGDVIERINLIRCDRVGRKLERISAVIQDELIDGVVRLEEKHWAERLGLALLNVLMVIPGFGMPAYIKYRKTGSAFFSLGPDKVPDESVCGNALAAVRCLKGGS